MRAMTVKTGATLAAAALMITMGLAGAANAQPGPGGGPGGGRASATAWALADPVGEAPVDLGVLAGWVDRSADCWRCTRTCRSRR